MRKILEASPIPNQITATVIIATDGMKRKNSVYGSSSFRTGRNEPIARPIGMPSSGAGEEPGQDALQAGRQVLQQDAVARPAPRPCSNTTVGGGNSTELTR